MLLQHNPTAPIIEGLNEFNEPSAQTTAPTTNKANGTNSPALSASPSAVGVSKDELTAAIEKARAEEKKKLYGQIEKEKTARQEMEVRFKSLEEEAKKRKQSKLSGEEQIQTQMAELQAQLTQRDERMTAMLQQQEAERRAYELGLYREKAIRDAGSHLMPDLVQGSSQAEIDAAVLVAKAEYAHWQQHFAEQFQPSLPVVNEAPQQLPTTVSPTQVMSGGQLPVQPPGPSVTNPAPMSQTAFDPQYVAQVTSLDSVRSGDYAKNREAILARLRQGVTPTPGSALPMRPMVPQAAPATQPQYQGHPQMTQQMPHTVQPGGVMQPQGLPTPPVHNPNLPQGGALGMPTVGQPQHQQVPNAMAANVDMRAQAAQAAHAALQDPQGAISRAGATAVPMSHPEYQPKNPAATGMPVPSTHTLQHGHPQIRNS